MNYMNTELQASIKNKTRAWESQLNNTWTKFLACKIKKKCLENLNWDEQVVVGSAITFVLSILKNVRHYPFHNIWHTLEVFTRSKYLCEQLWISKEDSIDIMLWAIFHDTWYIKQYFKNEEIWAKIAEIFLIKKWWKKERIEKIKWIIMATELWTKANNILEQIIQDADLDNLGRGDCIENTIKLREEIRLVTWNDIPLRNWLTSSYMLLKNHKFQTLTSFVERSAKKEENIRKLELRIAQLI